MRTLPLYNRGIFQDVPHCTRQTRDVSGTLGPEPVLRTLRVNSRRQCRLGLGIARIMRHQLGRISRIARFIVFRESVFNPFGRGHRQAQGAFTGLVTMHGRGLYYHIILRRVRRIHNGFTNLQGIAALGGLSNVILNGHSFTHNPGAHPQVMRLTATLITVGLSDYKIGLSVNTTTTLADCAISFR